MTEQEFSQRIKHIGASAYIVGGWVRDRLRGVEPKDKDYVVAGAEEAAFCAAFAAPLKVGREFPVYLLEIDGKKAEVALARKEIKRGRGYRGFSAFFSPLVTITEDLYRRDTTMNSIAQSLESGVLIDPFGGAADIERGIIRATSRHFLEDPLRALRAARQAAETGFRILPDTADLMRQCRAELAEEPKERLLLELKKALAGAAPDVFFAALCRADLLEVSFPEIFALVGKDQPRAYHPEGDAFVHSLQVLRAVSEQSERVEVRFAALTHDLGKGLTPPEMLPHHYGHEISGLEALAAWNRSMTLPKLWASCAAFVIREHMRVTAMQKPGKIVDFLLRLSKNPLGLDGMRAVLLADHGKLPPALIGAERILGALRAARGKDAPRKLQGRAVGAWIRQKQIELYLTERG